MVDDGLASKLAGRFVRKGYSVLDPFCGSGRLLVAAEARAASRVVGLDVNPLAVLLTRARLANPNVETLTALLSDVDQVAGRRTAPLSDCSLGKVEWFNQKALEELSQIVSWVNLLNLPRDELLVVGAIISGATRDSSFARKGGWKLHRMPPTERARFSASPWAHFKRRLQYYISQSPITRPSNSDSIIMMSDARDLDVSAGARKYDLVLTSPPYGDSQTTVQYGAASKLCLTFVSRIEGLQQYTSTSSIDGDCLGGRLERGLKGFSRKYWAGGAKNHRAARVASFLSDYALVCEKIAASLTDAGTAVIIVGQRSTGGFRLKLDQFTIDQLEKHGLYLTDRGDRRLTRKRLPAYINRFARSEEAKRSGLTRTMSKEYILVFEKGR